MLNKDISFVENPFEQNSVEKRFIILKKDDTLFKIADRENIRLENYIIYLNGNEINSQTDIEINNEDKLVFYSKISGSDGLKATIAMVAVAAIAWYATPYLAGGLEGLASGTMFEMGLGTAEFLTQTGIMLAGGLLVNHLFKFQPDLPKTKEKSPTYVWNESNPSAEGCTVPVVFGRTKIKPPIVSSNVNTTDGVMRYWGYKSDIKPYDTKIYLSNRNGRAQTVKNNTMTMRALIADHKIESIENVFINNTSLENYTNLFDKYIDYYNEELDSDGDSSTKGTAVKNSFDFAIYFSDKEDDEERATYIETWHRSLYDDSMVETERVGGDNNNVVYKFSSSTYKSLFTREGFDNCLYVSLNRRRIWKLVIASSDSLGWIEILDSKFKNSIIDDLWSGVAVIPRVGNTIRLFIGQYDYMALNSINDVYAHIQYRDEDYYWAKYQTPVAWLTNHDTGHYLQSYKKKSGGDYTPYFFEEDWQNNDFIPEIDFMPLFYDKDSVIENISRDNEVLKNSYRSYQMLYSTGGDFCNTSFENTLQYRTGSYSHLQFHRSDGFCSLVKHNDSILGQYFPAEGTYLIGLDNIKLSSPVFDKKTYQQELYPGVRDDDYPENEEDPEYLYFEPQQEEGIEQSGRRKAVYVSLTLPGGLYHIKDNGDNETHELEIKFEVRKKANPDGWREWGVETIIGNIEGNVTFFVGPFNNDKSLKEIYIDYFGGIPAGSAYTVTPIPPIDPQLYNISSLPETEPIEIRAIFNKKPELENRYKEQVIIDSVYAYHDYELQRFPGTSFLDLKLEASDYSASSLPPITMIIDRGTMKIYDYAKNTSFEVPSNSPAWQLLKLLTDKEFGVNMPMSNIVLETFQEWHDFCVEEGIESHYVIDWQGSFDEVTNPILTLGRANPVKYGNKYGISIDKKTDIISQIFNEENIISGSFGVEYFPEKEKANIFSIKFRDKNLDYAERTVEYRLPDTLIENERRIDLTLNNCADFVTAKNHAVWLAKSNHYCRKSISFSAGLESINCQVGDVVAVNFRGIAWGDLSARIKEFLGINKHRIYGDFTFLDGVEYFCFVRNNDTDIVTFSAITNISDENTPEDCIDIQLDFNGEIPVDSVITIGSRNALKNLYRITSITKDQEYTRKITALQYDERVYSKEDFVDEITDNPDLNLAPRYLTVKEKAVTGGFALNISWSGSSSSNEVKIYHNNSYITKIPVSTGNQTIWPIPSYVKKGDTFLVTVQKNDYKGDLYPDQRVEHVYRGIDENASESRYSITALFTSTSITVNTTPVLPDYLDFFVLIMNFEDVYTGVKTTKTLNSNVASFPYTHLENVYPGKYSFIINGYKDGAIVPEFSNISSIDFIVGSDDTDFDYTPTVTGLRLKNNQLEWTTKDLEITWNPITAYFEQSAGTAINGAGSQVSSITYIIEIRNSQNVLINEYSTLDNNYKYTFEENKEDNGGVPEPELSVFVYAVNNNTGEMSREPAILNITHKRPFVTELTGKSFLGGVFFNTAVLYPELIEKYLYKTITTESEDEPDWETVEWEEMYGNVYARTFQKNEEENKFVHFCIKAVNIYLQESDVVKAFEQPESWRITPTDIDDFALDASKLFLKIPVLQYEEWYGNNVDTISWNAHELYYCGIRFNIAAGSTTDKYVYFKCPEIDLNNPDQESYNVNYMSSINHPGDEGLLGENDFIMAVNINGHAEIAWNAIANEVIGSAYIMKGAIHDAHISNLSADKISLGPEKFWATMAGADNTQNAIDEIGVSIDNALAHGSTFIKNGLINSDLILVNDQMIVGRIGRDHLDDGIATTEEARLLAEAAEQAAMAYTQAWSSYGADNTIQELINGAIEYAKVNNYTIIDGGYINTSLIDANELIVRGNLVRGSQLGSLASKDSVSDADITMISGGKIKTGIISSIDGSLQINLNDSLNGLKLKHGSALVLDGLDSGGKIKFVNGEDNLFEIKSFTYEYTYSEPTADDPEPNATNLNSLTFKPIEFGNDEQNACTFDGFGKFLVRCKSYDGSYYKTFMSADYNQVMFQIYNTETYGFSFLRIVPDNIEIKVGGTSYNFNSEGFFAGGSNILSGSGEGACMPLPSGFTLLPSGIIIQWGYAVAGEDEWVDHAFPITFPTQALAIVGSGIDGVLQRDTDIQLRIKNQSGFSVIANAYSENRVNYIAIGY